MKTVLDNIIVEFMGSYGAEAQAKKLGLVKKPGFGIYGPPGQNIATHKTVDNGGRLIKMGSSGIGGDIEEAEGDSDAQRAADADELERKSGFNNYGPQDGDPKNITHTWDGTSMNPVHPDDVAGLQGGDDKDDGGEEGGMDTDGKISMPDKDDYDRAQDVEPEPEPQKDQPVGGQKGRRQAVRNLRLKIAQAGLVIKTKKNVGIYIDPDSVNTDKLAAINYTPAQARIIDALVQSAGNPVTWAELEGMLDAAHRKQKKTLPTNAPREFNQRQKQWISNMPRGVREYFVSSEGNVRSDLSWEKFKKLTKTVNNPEEYLNFFDDMFVAMNMADSGDAKGVQGFINKWGLAFEPKNNMYTQKILLRARVDGKVFETGAAAYVARYLQRTGVAIPIKSNLDPWSPQALVPSNPDDLASSITTRDGHTVIKFGNRTISTIPMDSEKYANLSNEDKKNVRQHNMKMELMKNHLFKDGQLNGVVITPEEGKLELTKSLKETITNTNVLTDQGKRDSIQLIEDIESFDTMGLTTERIKDVFNEFEGKFHNAWLDGAANERAASNALTPLSEAFSTLRETMLGDTVIVPNDTNFPGTDIISIKFKDPNVASLIHVEVTPDITFGQVKRGSGAASSTLHKIDTTIFSDYGDMSGDSIHQALKNSIERTHQLLWSSNDVETAAAEFQQHFDTMWPLVAEQYGVHPDQKEKFLKLIQSGKVPVINRKGQVRLNKSPNVPLGSKRRHSGCKKLRQHWQIHNSVGVMNMMIYNKQKSRQAINLHSHVIGKGIVETNGKESMYNLSPHLDKGLRDNCTPGTKHASYSKVDTSMNENIMESIVAEFLMREKENNDGIFNSRSLKNLALHHNVSIRDMSLELLKATKIEKDKGKDIKTAMKFAFINLSENFRYYD